jgi:hypothetical protein
VRIKIKPYSFGVAMALAWAIVGVSRGQAQTNAFTYQGQLMNNGQPATGNFDITFTLFGYNQYGFPVGPVLTNLNTPVNGGLFSAMLDFGAVFSGSNYWLEIAVRTNGAGEFTILQPRQAIAPVPYAMFSSNAATALVANSAASAASVLAGGIVGTIPLSNLSSRVALLTTNGTLPPSVLPTNFASVGGIVWQSPSATTVQALPNTGFVLTNSQQVTITLPTTPNIGDIVKIAGGGVGGWILSQNAGQTIAASFTPLSLPGDASGSWVSIASSSDGTKLAAANQGGNNVGGIWTSGNSGASWEQTSAPGGSWYSIASSSDGIKLAAVAEGVEVSNSGYAGGIWTSSNSGTNWTETSALPNGYEEGGPLPLASSSDGTKLVLAIPYDGVGIGGIWTSSNSSTNWVKTSAPTNVYWQSIASSADGTKLAAVAAAAVDGGGIWISSNSGTNWAQASDLPVADWCSVASSSNGTTLVAAAAEVFIGDSPYPGGIWISTDTGAAWTQTGAPGAYWTSIASSSDGTKLEAVDDYGWSSGGIWSSSNSGTNWVQIAAQGLDWVSTLSSSSWYCIASSSDGTKLAAGINGGGIWTVLNGVVTHESAAVSGSTMLGTTGFLQGRFGTVIELVYSGGGQFIAVYQNGVISGH